MRSRKSSLYAPIVVFGFNRPQHTSRLLESLSANPEIHNSPIYIFIDGPRNPADEEILKSTLKVVEAFSESYKVRIYTSSVNKGLVQSIKDGVNEVFKQYESIIVLEDDLILSENFLEFINRGLDNYKNNTMIASIQGYTVIDLEKNDHTYFQLGADCWGWATWRDRWMKVNWNADEALTELKKKKMQKKFDLNGAYPYTKMLERCSRGEVESWAIRWHASMFNLGKLSVYPPRKLVINTGRDGSGTHKGDHVKQNEYFTNRPITFSKNEPKESQLINWRIRRELRKRYKTHTLLSYKKYLNFVKRKIEPN